MKKLIGLLLNVLFIFAIYASNTGVEYADNLLNVMVVLYVFMTVLVAASIVGVAVMAADEANKETLLEFRNALKTAWISKLFYFTAIPLCAWFGNFIILGFIMMNALAVYALRNVLDAFTYKWR